MRVEGNGAAFVRSNKRHLMACCSENFLHFGELEQQRRCGNALEETELDKEGKSHGEGNQVEVFFQTCAAELRLVNTKNMEEFASR